jgi:hypothetical protein
MRGRFTPAPSRCTAPSRGGTHAEGGLGVRTSPCPCPEPRAAVRPALPACPPPYRPWYVPARAAPSPCSCSRAPLKAPLAVFLSAPTPPLLHARRRPPWGLRDELRLPLQPITVPAAYTSRGPCGSLPCHALPNSGPTSPELHAAAAAGAERC